ncbi:hypothetical protein [Halobacterium noricense]|uniref:hypothetical protein n=1 Tax=Halobacterium noricense TaxID=223182 RepID=UPI001E369257|nr:hypothetical protein [Halobacterium noricense]UHH26664.1 hypothetical protein LT974_06965 [Halobacterium noricense]
MPLPTPHALARTYNTPSYDDPWAAVEDYQRVLEYTAAHPDLGSSAVSSRLDLPRSRLRAWMNGSRPDAVRGIQTAEANGWLAEHATAETERALVQLAAWVLSGGSIHIGDSPHVYFSLDHDDGHFATLAAAAGFDYDVVNDATPDRATEARPTTDGAVLARVLVAMGVPADATAKQTATSLPAFVIDLDETLLEAFARIYVLNRGATHADKATLTIREQRPAPYLSELAAVLQSAASEPVTHSGRTVTISAAAARELLDDPA